MFAYIDTTTIWFVGSVVLVTALLLASRASTERRLPTDSPLVDAIRTTFSAPAFFVPAFMTAAGVTSGLALIESGDFPWLAEGETGLLVHGVVSLVVAAGIGGQIGLLEAHRNEQPVGPDAFVDGIRKYTLTLFLAKVVISWTMAVMLRPGFHPWRAIEDFQPIYTQYRRFSGSQFRDWLVIGLPSLALAPIVGTAARHPFRPIAALFSAIGFTVRHPWSVVTIVAWHAVTIRIALEVVKPQIPWTLNTESVVMASLTHGPALNFHLFPYVALIERSTITLLLVIMIALSSVFITAYWSLVARRPDDATENAQVEADPA